MTCRAGVNLAASTATFAAVRLMLCGLNWLHTPKTNNLDLPFL